MKTLSAVLASLLLVSAQADTGGPYEFVPDLAKDEKPPVLAIPNKSHLLTHYLAVLPKPKWEDGSPEPSSLIWGRLSDHHASISSIGYVGGYKLFSIRYTPKQKLEAGIDHADRILIVARLGNEPKCFPVYFSTGGASTYDHKARLGTAGKSINLEIARYHSGSGAHVDRVYLGRGEQGLVRVTPKPNAEQGVAPQSATRLESKSEGGDKPQPESEERSR